MLPPGITNPGTAVALLLLLLLSLPLLNQMRIQHL
jgi:hypothetical protein